MESVCPRERQFEGALSTVSGLRSACSLKCIYLQFAPNGKKRGLDNYMVINIKKENYIKTKNLVKKKLKGAAKRIKSFQAA